MEERESESLPVTSVYLRTILGTVYFLISGRFFIGQRTSR